MAVPSFQDLPLADRDRRWDGDAAEKRVRKFTSAEDGPNAAYRRVAAGVMEGARGGIDDVSPREATRIKNHLAKYYKKMDDTPPWDD